MVVKWLKVIVYPHLKNGITFWKCWMNVGYWTLEAHPEELASFRLVNQQEHCQFYYADYSLINRHGYVITRCSLLNSVKTQTHHHVMVLLVVDAVCIYSQMYMCGQEGVRGCTKKRRVMKMRILSTLMPWRIPLNLSQWLPLRTHSTGQSHTGIHIFFI